MLIVFTTTPNIQEAESLAKKIVAEKLAACVQVLPQMKSFYSWENDVRADSEHLLLIKTLEEKYEMLEEFIIQTHSYDVPEIVAVSAEKVAGGYLQWINGYLS
jgi:periplasmic divalent cation tolerance protein